MQRVVQSEEHPKKAVWVCWESPAAPPRKAAPPPAELEAREPGRGGEGRRPEKLQGSGAGLCREQVGPTPPLEIVTPLTAAGTKETGQLAPETLRPRGRRGQRSILQTKPQRPGEDSLARHPTPEFSLQPS